MGLYLAKRSIISELTGSASWLAILGASFFWVWLDRGMFGSALIKPVGQASVPVAIMILMGVNVITLWVFLKLAGRLDLDAWPIHITVLSTLVGVAGGALCILADFIQSEPLLYAGSVLLGIAMAYYNVLWGTISVFQGLKKTILNVSGAWGFGLVLNVALLFAPFIVESIVVLLLPAFSAVCFLALKRLQSCARYKIEFEPSASGSRVQGRAVAGVEVQFLVIILVFCAAFGFVVWFGAATAPASAELAPAVFAIARCSVAFIFFLVCLVFTTKRLESLLNIGLTAMVAGVILLTIGVFSPMVNPTGRVLVAMGYVSLDILVWTLVAYFSRPSKVMAVKAVSIAMIAEQFGILLGIVTSIIALIVHFDAFVSSVFLAAMNYLLLLSCIALLRRYDNHPILEERAPITSSLSHRSRDAVGVYAERVGFTTRESEIAYLLAEGRNVPYIAEKLFISENTVRSHIRHIYEKGNVHSRQEFLDAIEDIRLGR